MKARSSGCLAAVSARTEPAAIGTSSEITTRILKVNALSLANPKTLAGLQALVTVTFTYYNSPEMEIAPSVGRFAPVLRRLDVTKPLDVETIEKT